MAAEERAHAVVDPIIEELELELVDLVYAGGRLKIVIDHPDGLGTEVLTKATRMISHEIDLQEPINGAFTLEVSSPGVERQLRTPPHYIRSIGEQIAKANTVFDWGPAPKPGKGPSKKNTNKAASGGSSNESPKGAES